MRSQEICLANYANESSLQGCIGRLKSFNSRKKAKDVKIYVQGCLICQQKKYSLEKKLCDPSSLEISDKGKSYSESDFIVILLKTKNCFDCFTTWLD